jgi:hypothetical protein
MATAVAGGVSSNLLLTTINAEGITDRAPHKSIAEPRAAGRPNRNVERMSILEWLARQFSESHDLRLAESKEHDR